jgi:hypothetical protein
VGPLGAHVGRQAFTGNQGAKKGDNMKNEPAFPNEGFNGWGEPFQGMTLRDYFAIKCFQPIAKSFLEKELDLEDPLGWQDGLAMDAYSMADAMLKARTA